MAEQGKHEAKPAERKPIWPLTQAEFDYRWAAMETYGPERADALCRDICERLEPKFADSPTWEQLAPLYGLEV